MQKQMKVAIILIALGVIALAQTVVTNNPPDYGPYSAIFLRVWQRPQETAGEERLPAAPRSAVVDVRLDECVGNTKGTHADRGHG
ncbi:MAG TPA: hypothetical protein VF135_14965 [Terriglobales bacterium]